MVLSKYIDRVNELMVAFNHWSSINHSAKGKFILHWTLKENNPFAKAYKKISSTLYYHLKDRTIEMFSSEVCEMVVDNDYSPLYDSWFRSLVENLLIFTSSDKFKEILGDGTK